VLRIIDALGVDRCMYGTDWARTSGMATYEQGVAPVRNANCLSDSDRSKLMGGSLMKIYGC
jgi:L-fuconolactonase